MTTKPSSNSTATASPTVTDHHDHQAELQLHRDGKPDSATESVSSAKEPERHIAKRPRTESNEERGRPQQARSYRADESSEQDVGDEPRNRRHEPKEWPSRESERGTGDGGAMTIDDIARHREAEPDHDEQNPDQTNRGPRRKL